MKEIKLFEGGGEGGAFCTNEDLFFGNHFFETTNFAKLCLQTIVKIFLRSPFLKQEFCPFSFPNRSKDLFLSTFSAIAKMFGGPSLFTPYKYATAC